jgi:hypothetical protein
MVVQCAAKQFDTHLQLQLLRAERAAVGSGSATIAASLLQYLIATCS